MSRWQRRPGIGETVLEDDLYLVDPGSQEIVHLDPLAAALWRQLAEPSAFDDLLTLFRDAFPEVPPARLAADLEAALASFQAIGLAERASD